MSAVETFYCTECKVRHDVAIQRSRKPVCVAGDEKRRLSRLQATNAAGVGIDMEFVIAKRAGKLSCFGCGGRGNEAHHCHGTACGGVHIGASCPECNKGEGKLASSVLPHDCLTSTRIMLSMIEATAIAHGWDDVAADVSKLRAKVAK